MSGAKQSLTTNLASAPAYRHYPSGCAFGVHRIKAQALAVTWHSDPSSAGRDALATCIRGQEALAATGREVIGTSRVLKRTAVRSEDGVRLVAARLQAFCGEQ